MENLVSHLYSEIDGLKCTVDHLETELEKAKASADWWRKQALEQKSIVDGVERWVDKNNKITLRPRHLEIVR